MKSKNFETVAEASQKTYTTEQLSEGYNSVQHGVNSMGWLSADHHGEDTELFWNVMSTKYFGWYMHHIVSTIVLALCEGALALRPHGVPVCESDYYTKELEQCDPTF